MRTTIQQHPERSQPDAVAEILQQGYVAQIAFCEDQQPYVIPMAYHYDPAEPDAIYLHGSPKSRLLNQLAQGIPISLSVSLLDALVYSKTALYHSVNYRSVVAFGQGQAVAEQTQSDQIMKQMIRRYHPGREAGIDYESPDKHLKATLMVRVQLSNVSAKVRQGGPNGPGDQELGGPLSAGVVPLKATEPNWRPQEWRQDTLLVSTDPYKLQRDQILDWLQNSYWARDITPENLALRIEHAVCFGLYRGNHQMGFARLITDHASFAYLADVVIAPQARGQGFGRFLIESIQAHPLMQNIRWCLLSTQDAQGFYQQQGFVPHANPEKLMVYLPGEQI